MNSLLKNILFKKIIHLYVSVIIMMIRSIKELEWLIFGNIHSSE